MPALAILRRDLVRMMRSPMRTALMFAVPLVLATIMSFAFGGGGDTNITLTVLLQDDDDSLLTNLLAGSSGQFDSPLELVPVEGDGFERMEAGEASALLHIPAGFTDAYLAGEPTSLTLVKNPAEQFLPRIAEEGAGLGTAVLSAISTVFRDELTTLSTILASDAGPTATTSAALAAGVTTRINTLSPYLLPPVITLDVETVGANNSAEAEVAATSISTMSFVFPGLSVIGILFLAQSITRDIQQERESGLVRRLLTAPVTVADYLLGKTLSVVVITALGFGLLVLIGGFMGVRWGPPAAVAALVLATAIAAGGSLILIMSLVTTERQQDAITSVVIIVWSMVGGSMVPLASLPSFLLPISRTSLNYWSIDGFNTLILRGGGLADVGLNLAVLAGLGGLFLTIGLLRFRRALTTGAL